MARASGDVEMSQASILAAATLYVRPGGRVVLANIEKAHRAWWFKYAIPRAAPGAEICSGTNNELYCLLLVGRVR
jgi:hypothetical protein